MIPGQPGTKKWLEKYGDALICVRYRDDHQSQRRLKTIELVVESAPLKINKNTIPMNEAPRSKLRGIKAELRRS